MLLHSLSMGVARSQLWAPACVQPTLRGEGSYIDVIELACSVRSGKILVEFFFLQVYKLNLQKKNETNVFPVRTE